MMDVNLNIVNEIFYDFDQEEVSLIALINDGEYEGLPEEMEEELKAYKEFTIDPNKVLSVRIVATEEGVVKGIVLNPVRLFYELDTEEDKRKILPEEFNIATLYTNDEGEIIVGSLLEVLEAWMLRHDLRREYEKYTKEDEEK